MGVERSVGGDLAAPGPSGVSEEPESSPAREDQTARSARLCGTLAAHAPVASRPAVVVFVTERSREWKLRIPDPT